MVSSRNARMLLALIIAMMGLAPIVQGEGLPVKLEWQGTRIDVLIGGQPFTSYFFGPESPKPYLHPLRSPQGTVVTRGFPMRKDIPGERTDHPHHRAMYFGHGSINGVDFWAEEKPGSETQDSAHHVKRTTEGLPAGRTVLRKIKKARGGRESGSIRALFNLVGPDGKVIAREDQVFTFRGDASTRTIDCEFLIHATSGPVKMEDTKEGTFAIRLATALQEPDGGYMSNSEGAVGEKQIWGKRANWVDYSGTVAGEKLGIAIFDHPSNPKHPTYWHARGYGLFAVNPFGEHDFYSDKTRDGGVTIPAGGTMVLRYRVLIHSGNAGEADVAGAYGRYSAPQ
jgi:hypothetical protein